MPCRVGHLDPRLRSKGCLSCIRMKVKVALSNPGVEIELCVINTVVNSATRMSPIATDAPGPNDNALVTELPLPLLSSTLEELE